MSNGDLVRVLDVSSVKTYSFLVPFIGKMGKIVGTVGPDAHHRPWYTVQFETADNTETFKEDELEVLFSV